MMRKLLIALDICVAVTAGSLSVALAGFEEGIAAYKRGDHTTALKEFRVLTEKYNLGWMYALGQGVTQDYFEARKWYRKAAEQGVAEAQQNLGLMYFNGQGVAQDHVQALIWFNIGAKNGHENAKKGKNYVEKRMTASDISRAQELAKEWMAKNQK